MPEFSAQCYETCTMVAKRTVEVDQ